MSELTRNIPTFVHDSPLKEGEIRLLRIVSDNGEANSDYITCEIRRARLDDYTHSPSVLTKSPDDYQMVQDDELYIAMSYVWGVDTIKRKILCRHVGSGQSSSSSTTPMEGLLDITVNLEILLQHLQGNCQSWIWIDAICINQDDKSVEKSVQVNQMPDVYRRADHVLVWLGPNDASSDIVMKQIKEIGQDALDCGILEFEISELRNWPDFTTDSSDKDRIDKLTEHKNLLQKLSHRMHKRYYQGSQFLLEAFVSLTERPWFNRVWIIQEITVAHDATMVCGKEKVHYEQFLAAFLFYQTWISSLMLQLQRAKSTSTMLFRVFQLWWKVGTPFIKALRGNKLGNTQASITLGTRRKYQRGELEITLKSHAARAFARDSDGLLGAKDRRDRIYALLGISSDADDLAIVRDYQKDWQLVYTEVARRMIENGNMDILSLCRDREPMLPSRDSDLPTRDLRLPSWVPDWSIPILAPWGYLIDDGYFHASEPIKEVQHTLEFKKNLAYDKVIVLQGYYVDNIANVGSPWPLGRRDNFDLGVARMRLREVDILVSQSKKYTSSEKVDAQWRVPIGDRETTKLGMTQRASALSLQGYSDMKRAVTSTNSTTKFSNPGYVSYLGMMLYGYDSRPFLSAKGYVGLCPSASQRGDIIFIPKGAHVPYIIRKGETEYYSLIGEAYVYGIMDREYVNQNPEIDVFKIN